MNLGDFPANTNVYGWFTTAATANQVATALANGNLVCLKDGSNANRIDGITLAVSSGFTGLNAFNCNTASNTTFYSTGSQFFLVLANGNVASNSVAGYAVATFSIQKASVSVVTGNVSGNVNGNVIGTVASVTGAVGSVTGNVAGVTGSVGGNVAGNIVGNVSGNINGNVTTFSAGGLAQFFTKDSGTTYASAVTGSVVKEIVTNAVSGNLNVQAVVNGVWNEPRSNHNTIGTYGDGNTSGILDLGTPQSANANGIVLRSGGPTFCSNALVGATIIVVGSNQAYGQSRTILSNNGNTVAVDTFAATPGGNLSYTIFGAPPGSATQLANVNVAQWNGAAVVAFGAANGPVINGVNAGNITTNISGNMTGSVGSMNGNVGGSILGNMNGNIAGSVASVTGAVGSVTGAIGGNLNGSVIGSMNGNVRGNVNGTVASVIGAVGSVTGSIGGDLQGSVIGNVQGDVFGDLVGSVQGDVAGNIGGSLLGDVLGNVVGTVGNISQSAANLTANTLLDFANAIEVGATPRLALRYTLAAVAGNLAGGNTATVTIKGALVSTTRLTATIAGNGNTRTVVYG